MFEGLREQLDQFGLDPAQVILPGDPEPDAADQGALQLRPDGSGWRLETLDYGQGYPLGRADDEQSAADLLWGYVSRPLPPVRQLSEAEAEELSQRVAAGYFDLRDRTAEAGPDGMVIDLPPDLPVDRLGALDGVHLYPIRTPFELRSLPPNALRGTLHSFVTTAQVRVRVVITPPWFGRPGGGLRYTLQVPEVGIRDLVVSGDLQQVRIS